MMSNSNPNPHNHSTTVIDALLDLSEHLESEIAKGEALLERLPANPTYADLRELIWSDNAKRLESVGQ